MVKAILAGGVIFGVMVGWLYVQELYRRFARRHPELGPYRGEGGCGGSCSCRKGGCPAPSTNRNDAPEVDLTASVGGIERFGRSRW